MARACQALHAHLRFSASRLSLPGIQGHRDYNIIRSERCAVPPREFASPFILTLKLEKTLRKARSESAWQALLPFCLGAGFSLIVIVVGTGIRRQL